MLLLVLLVWLTEKMFVKAFKVHRSEKERDAYKHKQEEEGQDAAQGVLHSLCLCSSSLP